ncbi:MAG: imidazole glycerol phosphate synthase subunit HisH [Gammaproteobacteria bacterium]|nr:imidazole glycerol phosphate synthase subunit HisH [Gammaproteobacteria bacterium]
MNSKSVAIIDGGGANIASLTFALARCGYEALLTVDPQVIAAAGHVILPGVGAAEDSMNRLRAADLLELIPGLRQPVLGICLGMQLFFDGSEENDTRCLGIFPGTAKMFEAGPDLPVPHMGWNQIERTRDSDLMQGIPDGSHFYFVHSYALDVRADTLACTEYGRKFTAIAERNNFAATQFHPERSGEFGARLLQNFLRR